MRSVRVKPTSPLLAASVKSLHYLETEMPFMLERIVPNGQAHLMINLAEEEFRAYDPIHVERVKRHSGAVLAGPHARSTVIDTREQRWLVAVEFRSGGAGQFFSMPMSEACDAIVSLEDVWDRTGRLLREQLLEAKTPALKFRVLEETLLRRRSARFDPAIQYAVYALRRGVPLARVTEELGLLPRTLVRRFSSQVGMAPKRFARLQRLQRVLGAVCQSPAPDWRTLAMQHGYTDQSHLVHEFREMADITPSGYKPHSAQRRNHIPIRVS
jgi:AraC-like DNA-binding protein